MRLAISQGTGDFLHLLVICVHECGMHYFLMSSVKHKRKSKGERIMENVLKHFEDMQSEAEKRYGKMKGGRKSVKLKRGGEKKTESMSVLCCLCRHKGHNYT